MSDKIPTMQITPNKYKTFFSSFFKGGIPSESRGIIIALSFHNCKKTEYCMSDSASTFK